MGRAGKKQTTEGTEDTEKNKPRRAQRGRAATKQAWRHKKSSRAEKNLRASSTENTEKRGGGHAGPYTRQGSVARRAVGGEGTEKANHREHGGHGDRKRRGGGLRWSAEACGPDGVGTPVQLRIVSLCRRDRRHGKPGGLLHGERRHRVREGGGLRAPRPAGKPAAG